MSVFFFLILNCEYLPNKGGILLCSLFCHFTSNNIKVCKSASPLGLWNTSRLPLAQAAYRLKTQIYMGEKKKQLCKTQLQITLSTNVQEQKRKGMEGGSPVVDTQHIKRHQEHHLATRSNLRTLVQLTTASLVKPANQIISRGTLHLSSNRKQATKQNVYKGQDL